MLLVIHPAIGVILAAKPIFHRVDPVLEESGYFGLDAGAILRMDTFAPERWILKIFGRGVAKDFDDVVADEGGSEVAGRLEAVDHGRRRTEQSLQSFMRRGLRLPQSFAGQASRSRAAFRIASSMNSGGLVGVIIVRGNLQGVLQGRRGDPCTFFQRRHEATLMGAKVPLSARDCAVKGARKSARTATRAT